MGDAALIQIVDAAMAEAARKAGSWLACRPGCFHCCIGPFAVTPLDAQRLREGLAELETRDPKRAAEIRRRARESVDRMTRQYTLEEILNVDAAGEDELCPALDPGTGTCDLYAFRPITCRTFGPAVRFGDEALAVCELCFEGATDEEIAACEVIVDPENLEAELLSERAGGDTIVAFALLTENTPAHFPAST